jgi:hypothetical protein
MNVRNILCSGLVLAVFYACSFKKDSLQEPIFNDTAFKLMPSDSWKTRLNIEKKIPQEAFQDTMLVLGQKDTCQASVLFKGSAKELLLVWNKENTSLLKSILVQKTNAPWYVGEGIGMGSSLKAVEKANGKAFSISGFHWEFGGHVVSWEGGKFQNSKLDLGFAPGSTDKAITGATEFYTNHQALQEANPVVNYMAIDF